MSDKLIQINEGIYTAIPYETYEKWDAINQGILWILLQQSPLHAKTYKENPQEPTDALITGQVAHTLALEPNKFKERYAIALVCDKRTKEGKSTYEHWLNTVNGRQIITQIQYEQAKAVADSVLNHRIKRFIQQGEAEICIIWQDKKTKLLCKARLDYVHRKRAIIIDLKTTTDASPKAFQSAMIRYGYYVQAAFYSDGWKALTGDEPSFVFLPIEKEIPHAVAAREIGDKTLLAGRLAYRKALEIYSECLKTNIWPSYPDVELIEAPDWFLKQQGVNQYQIHIED